MKLDTTRQHTKKGAHKVHHYQMRHTTGRKIQAHGRQCFPHEDYNHAGESGQQERNERERITRLYIGGVMRFLYLRLQQRQRRETERETQAARIRAEGRISSARRKQKRICIRI